MLVESSHYGLCPDALTVLMAFQELLLDHVFGYRGFDCRNNLHYLNDGADIIFHTAATVVLQSLSAGKMSATIQVWSLTLL